MKHLMISAFSIATLAGACLHAGESPSPAYPSYMDASYDASYMDSSYMEEVDHPLYPENRPHLFSVGMDFLTARFPRSIGGGSKCNHKHHQVFMPGARLSYEYLRPDSIYFGLNGEIGWFQKNHSKWVAEKPSLAEVRLGYNFSFINNCGYALISPYVGFGVASSKIRFGSTSHVRASFASLGVRSRYAMCPSWSIGLDAQVVRTFSLHSHTVLDKETRFFLENMQSLLSSSDASNCSDSSGSSHSHAAPFKCPKRIKTKLDNRWTGEVAIPVTYYMGEEKQWSVEVAPYVTGLTLSKVRPYYGARATLGYRF